MSRDPDPYRIPLAGPEAAPLAGLAGLEISGGPLGLANRRMLVKSTLAGVMVVAAYQALLTGLRSEALVRRGLLGRPAQARLILGTVLGSVREGAAVSLGIALLLLICPWLSLPLGVLGVIGAGKASLDLFHAFWDGLSPWQQQQLHEAAYAAGAQLGDLVRQASGGPRLEP
ncbi:MAG: hypothetical protein VKO65_08355 [Cyanobacteriota bacterium]|nr:hypothetical protein [Cyanobacteriota bacterium]